MKATVIVSKDADFSQNPVGFVDVNPIPDAARDGLQVALLTTRSERATLLDRVSGDFRDAEVSLDTDSVFTAQDLRMKNRQTGFKFKDWPEINYSTGFTIIAVVSGDVDFTGTTGAPIFSSLDAGTNLPDQEESRGFRIAMRIGNARGWVTNQANTAVALSSRTIGPGRHLVGFSYDPSDGDFGSSVMAWPAGGTSFSRDPLEQKDPSGDPASSTAGVSLLQEPQAGDAFGERKRSVSFVAQYNRPMTQEEVEEIYLALKPWLASVGVEIE